MDLGGPPAGTPTISQPAVTDKEQFLEGDIFDPLERELGYEPQLRPVEVFRPFPVPSGDLTEAEMKAAKEAPRKGSITGVKTKFGEAWDVVGPVASPVAPPPAAPPAPPAAPPKAPADIPSADVVEAEQVSELEYDAADLTPDELEEEAYEIKQQKVFEVAQKIPKTFKTIAQLDADLKNIPNSLKEIVESIIPKTAQSAASIALQLAQGRDITNIALNKLQRAAVSKVTKAAVTKIVKAATEEAASQTAGMVVGATAPVISAAINMAIAGKPVTAESVAQAGIQIGLMANPITPWVMLAKGAMDLKLAKDKMLHRKREYEDRAFSAPIKNLQPNLHNIQQSTEHSYESIDKLFKENWAGEKNYLGQQLAKELDPPDGARYYHGDESVRVMMQNTLGVIQKYRNTVPAYNNVWNQFARGQISQGEFKAQSQRVIDNYIVGKLGAKRILKSGEVRIYNARSGEWASTTSIVDLNTEDGRDAYYNTTGKPPPGWSKELINPDGNEYEWINIAERNKRIEALDDPGQWD